MDPTLQQAFAQSMARLNEIGNLSVQQATENSGRLSAMFGVRAAQSNPIEADAITSLHQAQAGGNANTNALAGALAAILANLAHSTPSSQPSAAASK
jgi:hypothetical protein